MLCGLNKKLTDRIGSFFSDLLDPFYSSDQFSGAVFLFFCCGIFGWRWFVIVQKALLLFTVKTELKSKIHSKCGFFSLSLLFVRDEFWNQTCDFRIECREVADHHFCCYFVRRLAKTRVVFARRHCCRIKKTTTYLLHFVGLTSKRSIHKLIQWSCLLWRLCNTRWIRLVELV